MLTVKTVAERLSLSLAKVYELIQSGELPCHRFGRSVRVSEEQLRQFLNETRVKPVRAIPLTRPRLKHLKKPS